jgi:hypothetical protein
MTIENTIRKFLLETKEEKIYKLLEKYMEDYTSLIELEREYEDFESGEVYTTYVYYKDPELDWEDDEFIFKLIPIDNWGEKFNLEYNAWELKGGTSTFGKQLFERFLKPWFEKTYKLVVEAVYPV